MSQKQFGLAEASPNILIDHDLFHESHALKSFSMLVFRSFNLFAEEGGVLLGSSAAILKCHETLVLLHSSCDTINRRIDTTHLFFRHVMTETLRVELKDATLSCTSNDSNIEFALCVSIDKGSDDQLIRKTMIFQTSLNLLGNSLLLIVKYEHCGDGEWIRRGWRGDRNP